MKNKMKIKLTSIIIGFLFILLCEGDTTDTLTFYDGHLTPLDMVPYSDNSVVFRLVERLNNSCNVPNLTYRILYPNGTDSNLITIYDYDHQIPSFNFCARDDRGILKTLFLDHLNSEKTIINYILITYVKEENDIISTFGMMIDWSGKITR